MSFLDVRNQAGNCRLNFTDFKTKNTVLVMHLTIENSKKAKNEVLSDLKGRSEVRIKHFKVKITRAWG